MCSKPLNENLCEHKRHQDLVDLEGGERRRVGCQNGYREGEHQCKAQDLRQARSNDRKPRLHSLIDLQENPEACEPPYAYMKEDHPICVTSQRRTKVAKSQSWGAREHEHEEGG